MKHPLLKNYNIYKLIKNKSSILSLLSLILSITARILVLISQIFIARRLNIYDYGQYTTFYAILNPIIVFSGFGLDIWLLRQSHNQTYIGEITSHIFCFRFLVTALLIIILVPFMWFQHKEWSKLLIVLGSFNVLLEVITSTGEVLLRTQLKFLRSNILLLSNTFIIFFLLWLVDNTKLSFQTMIIFRLYASFLCFIYVYWSFRKFIRYTWNLKLWINIILQAKLYFFSEILSNITLRGDLTLLAIFIGSSATAIYNPTITIINTLFLLPNIAMQILLPMLSNYTKSSKSYKQTIQFWILTSILYGLFWFFILKFYSISLVTILFGKAYIQTSSFLEIMSLIPLLKSLNFCWVTIIITHDQQFLRTKMQLFGASTSLFGNLIFIPLFGIYGAAVINVITELTLFIGYGYGCWKVSRKP